MSDENDPFRVVASGRGVVGLFIASGMEVGASWITAELMPSNLKYVSMAKFTSVVDFPNDLFPKWTVSGPDPRLMTPSMTVG